MSHRVLIIESAQHTAMSIEQALTHADYSVDIAQSARSAWCSLTRYGYDAIVWNVLLSSLDPVRAIRKYRNAKLGTAAIIAMGEAHTADFIERILDAGADDFMEPPFETRKLIAVVRANLQRTPPAQAHQIIRLRDLELDTTAGTITKSGKPIHLFPKEYSLLSFLMKNPNKTFAARALAERVWRDKSDVSGETVRTHIKTLRRKIDSNSSESMIVNEPGRGYRLIT